MCIRCAYLGFVKEQFKSLHFSDEFVVDCWQHFNPSVPVISHLNQVQRALYQLNTNLIQKFEEDGLAKERRGDRGVEKTT